MQKIGICGTIASGKSTFSILLKRRGYAVFNADGYARLCLQKNHPAYKKIVTAFTEDILDENGEILRAHLAKEIFSDDSKREELNAITHPYIIEGMKTFFKHHETDGFAFAEVPLLFESHLESYFDRVVLITCSKETAIKRMMEDRNYTEEEALARYASQMDPMIQVQKADEVIYNDGTLKELEGKAFRLIKELSKEQPWS